MAGFPARGSNVVCLQLRSGLMFIRMAVIGGAVVVMVLVGTLALLVLLVGTLVLLVLQGVAAIAR